MNAVSRLTLTTTLLATPLCCNADDALTGCLRAPVEEHVRQQYRVYGPKSAGHEYFGFIYLWHGVIESAVVRGKICPNPASCGVDTRAAAQQIPVGAKVLGEWHTHLQKGSATLSIEDVLGAHSNRQIRCYAAFYSKPNGEIYRWDPQAGTVSAAMASLVPVTDHATQLASTASSTEE